MAVCLGVVLNCSNGVIIFSGCVVLILKLYKLCISYIIIIIITTTTTTRLKNPPSRGAGCALQQECRRDSKLRQLPTTKHFENSSIIFIAAHQKSQTTRSCKFLSVLAPKSVGRVFGSWRSTTTTITTIIIIIIITITGSLQSIRTTR